MNAVFITARTDSTRLPNKICRILAGKPIYEHLIERALQTKADKIVFCTTFRKIDDKLAKNITDKILLFRGDYKNKLHRWLSAAKTYSIDEFVEFDGDDLLCDIEMIDKALTALNKADFVTAPPNIITGAFTFGIRTEALEKAYKDTTCEIIQFKLPKTIIPTTAVGKKIRLTLDYPEDLEMFRELYKIKYCTTLPLSEVLTIFEEHPQLSEINWYREKDYKENQQKILFAPDIPEKNPFCSGYSGGEKLCKNPRREDKTVLVFAIAMIIIILILIIILSD